MKKILLLLAVCFTFTSCSSVGTKTSSDNLPVQDSSYTESTVETSVPEAEQLQFTDCYQSEVLEVPQNLFRINDIITLANSDDIIVTGTEDNFDNILYFRTDKTFSDFMPFEYERPAETDNFDAVYSSTFFNPDGTFNALYTLENHGGMKLPADRDENFDYDTYYSNCETSYMIASYSADGRLLASAMFEYPENFYDDYGYVMTSACIADNDTIIVAGYDNSFWRIGSDGLLTNLFTNENDADENSYSFYHDCDGKIICAVYSSVLKDNTYYSSTSFHEFTDKGLSSEPFFTSDEYNSISTGYGKYRLFFSMYDALYGFTTDGELESVVNWSDSNVEPMEVTAVGEDEYIGIEENNDSSTNLLKLTPRDMSELANTKFITISSAINDDFYFQDLDKIINRFNNSQNDYHIRISKINGETDDNGFYSTENALNMMILKGETPDIIFGLDYDKYVNYRKKDVFTDLYNFIDNDSELSREDFLPNILSALESPDSRLYAITDGFDIRTLCTKTSVYNKENWTLDEFLSTYDNAPDSFNHLYDGTNKIEMLNNMTFAITDFIDYENVVCHFDSPDFIKILEFCNRFVDEVPKPDKVTESEAFSNYYAEKLKWLGNDKILFEKTDALSYNYTKYLQAEGNELTFAGYPSTDGRGGLIIPGRLLCISTDCAEKDGAWEFVKFYIQNSDGCSVLNEKFEKFMDSQMYTHNTASGIEIPPFDKETRDMVAEYMKSCTKLCMPYDSFYYPAFDNDIMAIMEEEAGLYFNNEQTVEIAAEHIQNRVSVLISERS